MCLEKGSDQLIVYRGINRYCIQCHKQLIRTLSRDGRNNIQGQVHGSLVAPPPHTFKLTFLNFYLYFVAKFQRLLSSWGMGGKALMARPLREEFFCGFPKIFCSLVNWFSLWLRPLPLPPHNCLTIKKQNNSFFYLP